MTNIYKVGNGNPNILFKRTVQKASVMDNKKVPLNEGVIKGTPLFKRIQGRESSLPGERLVENRGGGMDDNESGMKVDTTQHQDSVLTCWRREFFIEVIKYKHRLEMNKASGRQYEIINKRCGCRREERWMKGI